ncbi:CocE/NonD family hydrolase [Lentzea sp. NPDC051213]|uniref:CocE/NonD family hydrolase n=1 Tax=Lentzea sp. NPDC051213 TaxID=3364126 RepID=UPI0037ACA6D9
MIETVSIETGLDTDRDGVLDRVWADIMRPGTSEKVPVVMEASPYHEGFKDRVADPAAGPGFTGEVRYHWPAFRMAARGYAYIWVQVQGTGRSTGCTDVGGPDDLRSMAGVISWLTGGGKAWNRAGEPVTASWSSGSVGMIGHSYDGTLAIGLASAGVRGLKAIVPTSAISRWYGWTRINGLLKIGRIDSMSKLAAKVAGPDARARCAWKRDEIRVAEDSENADMNAFWDARDYVRDTSRYTAATLTMTGQRDFNVPITQFTPLWEALGATGVPRRAWITEADHNYVPGKGRFDDWNDLVDRWFDRWLRGERNGVDREPAVDVQDVDQENWVQQARWPQSRHVRFFAGQPVSGRAPLRLAPASGTFDIVPTGENKPLFDTAGGAPIRLFAAGPVRAASTRIAGTPVVTASVTPTTSSTPLSAYLVSFADGDQYVTALARGVIDLKNRQSLRTATPLTPGQPVSVRFALGAVDRVVPAGHRLGLVLIGDNFNMDTHADPLAGPFTVNLAGTSISVPIA